MKWKYLFAVGVIAFFYIPVAGQFKELKVYPTHWWTGMKEQKLQLLIHAANIKSGHRVFMDAYPGVKLVKRHTFQNRNYLTIDLEINKTAKPGKLHFRFMSVDMLMNELTYELKPRSQENGKTRIKGITSEDLIYLIMPDRFCNGKQPARAGFRNVRRMSLARKDDPSKGSRDLKLQRRREEYCLPNCAEHAGGRGQTRWYSRRPYRTRHRDSICGLRREAAEHSMGRIPE